MPITRQNVSIDVSNEAIFQFTHTLIAPLVPRKGAKKELNWTNKELTMNRI